MAGAGWRQFTVGQLLTSAQVQTYMQDQAVQVHASAAARSSALGTAVSAGMVSYRADDKALELYGNSVWTPVMQGRNVLINGGFDFWQRGTSFSTTLSAYVNYYTADRWTIVSQGTPAVTISQQNADTLGFGKALRFGRTAGNTSTSIITASQVMESAESAKLAGKTVTLSFSYKSGANLPALSAELRTGTQTDSGIPSLLAGGWTSPTSAITASVSLTSTTTRVSYTVTLPTNTNQIAVIFYYTPSGTAGANEWAQVEGVQLEAGSVATSFVRAGNTLQGELAACQRYYWQLSSTVIYTYSSGAGQFRAPVYFPVSMRTAPTVTATQVGGGTQTVEFASANTVQIGSTLQTYISALTASSEL